MSDIVSAEIKERALKLGLKTTEEICREIVLPLLEEKIDDINSPVTKMVYEAVLPTLMELIDGIYEDVR